MVTNQTYKRIYKKHYGPIPIDCQGRSYEIHHIDGNHTNNDPSNLKAITIQEHYDIHYQQGDWYACLRIAERMNKSPQEISELARQSNLKRMKENRHHFLDSSWQKLTRQKLLNSGWINPFIGPSSNKNMLVKGIHPSQKIRTCPHCGKQGKAPGIFKWHFDKCRKLL